MYNLSEKAIAEKYEDLLFTKVMALYAAEESEKILSEIENEEPADPKNIEKIYSKTERRENFSVFWKVSKKLITFAAMVVFVAVVSLSSVVVASAEAREAVAEAIYHLVLRKTDRYTEVSIGNSTGFIDPEIYDWEGAYAPTYMPEGFVIEELHLQDGFNAVVYCKEDYFIVIDQMNNSTNMQLDTENAEVTENIRLHNSDGFLVVNENLTIVIWSEGETIFEVSGNIATDEIIKIAESLKPVRNTEKLIPTSGYKFVDPENYNFEGAYAPTYIPEGFVLLQKQRFGSQYCVDYKREGGYISFLQAGKDVIFQVDTEGADTVEKILIGESEGLLVSEDGNTYLNWSIGNTNFQIYGTCEIEEIIKMAKGIKPLGKTEEPTEEYEFVDPEIYDWEGAYAPTYVPNNYKFSDKYVDISYYAITYTCNDKYFYIDQTLGHPISQIDTENAQIVKEVIINGGQGILVVKNDLTSITWNVNNILFDVGGTAPTEEIIKIAESLKPIGKTEEPTEEYEFVDPEIYTWENAYGLTYVTENYDFYSVKDLEISRIVNYMQGEKYISFVQYTDTTVATDTEDADITKEIQIGESKGFLVVKDDWSCVFYSVEDILLQVSGTAPTEEIIKVAEGIKPLGKTETEENEFVDPENYDWEGAYAPTYVPEGFNFVECVVGLDSHSNTYENNEKFVIIEQKNKNYTTHIDTENADIIKELTINNSQALYVEKGGLAYITWSFPDTLLFVCGNIDGEEIIKIAEGVRPMN